MGLEEAVVKVLLLTQVLPYPPDSGPKVKTWNVLKYLAERYEVTLASFVRCDQSADVARLQRYCRAVHTVPMERGAVWDGLAMMRSMLTGQPWMMVRDDRAAMRRLVDRLAAEGSFDVVHADQLNMAQYAVRVPRAFKVLDAHNALWLLYKRLAATMRPGLKKWLLERDWRLLRRYEGKMVQVFDAVMAVNPTDRDALLEAAPVHREVIVIPIGVDTEDVTPIPRQSGANHILYVGTMYWPPNIDGVLWFARHVFPLIRQQRPDVQLDIVGARPPREVVTLGRDDVGINVTGYVEDLTPHLQRCALMVVPLRAGGGMRVKILNGLAQGLPIVSTTLGCEGIAVTPGRDILVADEPDEFATAVLRVLNEADLAKQLSLNGRRLVESQYDYRHACAPLDGLRARIMRQQAATQEKGDWVTKERIIWAPRALQLLREGTTVRYAQTVVPRLVDGVHIRFPEIEVSFGLRVAVRSRQIEGQSLLEMVYGQETQDLALDMAIVALKALEMAAVVSDPFRLFGLAYGLVRRLKVTTSELYGESILSPKQRGRLNRLVANYTQNKGVGRRVLVHGDLHAGNLLVNCEERLLGFVDLEMLHIGKSATNFAQLWISFHFAAPSLGQRFYRRYVKQFPQILSEQFDSDVRAEVALRCHSMVGEAKKGGNAELGEKSRILLGDVLGSKSFEEFVLS
jgi:glycosyltransferase involved in cell wall biosynthesis